MSVGAGSDGRPSAGGSRDRHPPRRSFIAVASRGLQPRVRLQYGGFVGGFPGEFWFVAAEVAVGGGFAVDGAQQVEGLDDAFRPQVEVGADEFNDFFIGYLAGAEGVDHQRYGLGDTNRVGDLDFAAGGQAGGDDVFGDITTGVGGGAVDLGGVFAGERATAVTCCAAVGVDDDLAAGQAAVAGPCWVETTTVSISTGLPST